MHLNQIISIVGIGDKTENLANLYKNPYAQTQNVTIKQTQVTDDPIYMLLS